MLTITGGNRLCGDVLIHGAKNSALPILAACAAVDDLCEIHNCPQLSDTAVSVDILRCLGCSVRHEGNTAYVNGSSLCGHSIPEELMREMRSSISFLGAMLARCGKAELFLPGGCELGSRPVDLHLSALLRMGADIEEKHGGIHCSVSGRLHGADIPLGFPSVGATENVMVAAATAEGVTVITNAAREPEITDLADFLNACGADISGAGSSTVTIRGVQRLHGCVHSVIPDRIEAATYMTAAAITGGCVKLHHVCTDHLQPVIPVFEEMGCTIRCQKRRLELEAPPCLSPVKLVRTMPYPGFPTDAQAIVMACACVAKGTSLFVENIFDSRFKHVSELCRLGASIKTEGRAAIVEGVEKLTGASVCSTDLRGGAALVVAALAADGTTGISRPEHIDRGYCKLVEGLYALGAQISRRD